MKRFRFNKVEISIRRYGFSRFLVIADYRRKQISFVLNSSAAYNNCLGSSGRLAMMDARRSIYFLVVNEYKKY